MRRYLLLSLTLAVSLFGATSAAQAVVLDINALGQTTVPYNSSNQSGYIGAALMPGVCGDLTSGNCAALANAGVPRVTSSAPCTDPALTPDLWVFGQAYRVPDNGLCYHGGPVMHQNETFALTWDAPFASGTQHNYWEGTRDYVEQYLRDVADGSGTLSSPYAVTTQYTDSGGRAQNSSKFGGGCIDYGSVGDSQCEFGAPTGAGHDYPVNGCTPVGASFIDGVSTTPNTVCLTDSQIQSEVSTMAGQTGIIGRTQPGYTPTVVLLTPPGVETCLDPTSKLCSANGSLTPAPPGANSQSIGGGIRAGTYRIELSYVGPGGEYLPSAATTVAITSNTSIIVITSPKPVAGATSYNIYVSSGDSPVYVRQNATPIPINTDTPLTTISTSGATPRPSFCSYHSQVAVGGTMVAYVVQPWTGLTGCDEPDAPAIPPTPTPAQLSTDFGVRLVSPLSQSHIASILDSGLNAWIGLDGAEVNDNGGCTPLASGRDSVTVGGNTYLLQREFNNAGAIESEPYTYGGCAPNVVLTPTFVVPSAINQGDELQLDGSTTPSTLIVSNGNYQWDFGDGTNSSGPSVVHSYAKGGTYIITLTVTDRGGNQAHLKQTVSVLDQNGQVVVTPSTGTGSSGGGGTTGSGGSGGGSGPGGASGGNPGPGPLQVHLLLLPQSLTTALQSGIAVRVSANQAADGFAYVMITKNAAKKAGIKAGRGPMVNVGRGTVSKISNGTAILRLHLTRSVAAKLKRLRHVTLTVKLSLVSAAGGRLAAVAAAHY